MKYKLLTAGCGFIGTNVVKSALKTVGQMNLGNFDMLTSAGIPSSLVDLESDSSHCFVACYISETKLVSAEAAEFWFKPNCYNLPELKQAIIRINTVIRIGWNLVGVPALYAKDKHVKPYLNMESLA